MITRSALRASRRSAHGWKVQHCTSLDLSMIGVRDAAKPLASMRKLRPHHHPLAVLLASLARGSGPKRFPPLVVGIKLNGSRSCFVVIRVRPSTSRLFILGKPGDWAARQSLGLNQGTQQHLISTTFGNPSK